MTYADFRSYKLALIRRNISKARNANASGKIGWAAWYLHLASVARQSITEVS